MPGINRYTIALRAVVFTLALGIAPAQKSKELGVPLVRNFSQKELQFVGQVWGAAQDRRGVMYFASTRSVLEYDGATWRKIPVPSATARQVAMDASGRMWVGAVADLGYLGEDANGSTRFVSLLDKIPQEHRVFNDVWQVLPTSSGVYFRTYDRLFRWDGQRMQVWSSETRIEGLGEVHGRIYVAHGSIGLMELRGNDLVPVPGGEAYKDSVRLYFYAYDDRRMLVAARYKQLSLFDGEKATPFRTEADDYLLKALPYSTIVLPDGALCIVTTLGGAAIVERDGRLRRLLNRDFGLAGNSVTYAASDHLGNLWLTRGDGISRVEINSPISVLSPLPVATAVRFNGSIYTADATSGQAVSRVIADATTGLSVLKPVATGTSQCFWLLSIPASPGGPPSQLLAGTGIGVLRIEGDASSRVLPERRDPVFSLLRSKRNPNRVFVGMSPGLASIRWEGGRWIDEGTVPGLTGRTTSMFEAPDGSLWADQNSKFIIRITIPPSGVRAATLERFDSKNGLPRDRVVVASIDGQVLVAGGNGAFRFDAATRRFVEDPRLRIPLKSAQAESTYAQLRDGSRFGIARDGAEQNQGLFRLQPDGTFRLEEQAYRSLSQFSLNDVFLDDDGKLIFSGGGLLRFDRAQLPAQPPPFTTLVRDVITGNGEIIFGGRAVPGAGIPALAYGRNSLRFQFSSTAYGNEEENAFQYRLEGSDRDWSQWSTTREASYNNIGPGDYRFRVRSRTFDGRLGEEAEYAFSITPPWYRTNFAYIGYALLFLLAGAAARYRIIAHEREKSRRNTEALETTVAERTAEIAAQRDNIALLGEIGKEITASLELETVLYKLYECVNKIVDASVFGVGLYRPEKGIIEYDLAIENGKRYAPYSRSTADKNQFAVWCVDNRKPVLINDVNSEYSNYISQYQHKGRLLEDGTAAQAPVSMIYLPLLAKDRVLGVLALQSFQRNAYTSEDLSLLENLASYTAIALDNAGAYRRVNDRERELSTVNRITQALSTQLDTAGLVQLVGEQIRSVFNAQIAYVSLLDRATMMLHFPYTYGEEVESRPFGDGLTSQIIRTGQPLLINQDVGGNTARLGLQNMGREAASYLGVPIPSGGEFIGVLSVQSLEEEGRFTLADQGLLTTIAASVGVAFHNAKLFEDARQARAAAEEADAAKSSFLSTVSHELRTPLTSVLGFAKIIKKRLEDRLFPLIPEDDKKVLQAKRQVAENLDVVVSEGQRLTKLIDDVLDLAKIEAGKFTWNMAAVSVPEVIDRAVAATSSLFEAKRLTMRKEVEASLPAITGDADRLMQVVINLISNAVKFTDEGSIVIAAGLRDGRIQVSVTDSGIGIRPEDQPKVFEKFKQVGDTLTDKPKGTGLGLPICREIVEFHGGRIWVESTPGSGSTFTFTLPTGTAAAAPRVDIESIVRQLRDNVASQAPRPHSVLVVDDDAHIRSLLQQELTEAGYVVRTAENGRLALALVREEHPGLIILDVMMPEMNGFDVAAVLKNDPATAEIPIIILSIVEDKERGFRLGVDRYLTKPIDTASLFREVDTLLDQGKSHRKVLIVDEDASTIRSLAEVLEARGYHVTESNGSELVSKAVSSKPDIIVLNSLLSSSDHVRSLRFEKGLENVLFLIYQ
jgi:signal transduction histidine kinase/CheY-like chemotaxis protein